eukprot:11788-Prymnesium_polylepis.2
MQLSDAQCTVYASARAASSVRCACSFAIGSRNRSRAMSRNERARHRMESWQKLEVLQESDAPVLGLHVPVRIGEARPAPSRRRVLRLARGGRGGHRDEAWGRRNTQLRERHAPQRGAGAVAAVANELPRGVRRQHKRELHRRAAHERGQASQPRAGRRGAVAQSRSAARGMVEERQGIQNTVRAAAAAESECERGRPRRAALEQQQPSECARGVERLRVRRGEEDRRRRRAEAEGGGVRATVVVEHAHAERPEAARGDDERDVGHEHAGDHEALLQAEERRERRKERRHRAHRQWIQRKEGVVPLVTPAMLRNLQEVGAVPARERAQERRAATVGGKLVLEDALGGVIRE